jgi:hypothetical protein
LPSHLTILIIRHAEKPDWPEVEKPDWPGPGLKANGSTDPNSLIVRGWQRAGAWSALFGAGLGGKDYPQPETIYAADPDPDPKKLAVGLAVGQRPYETIIPLKQRLNRKRPLGRTWGSGASTAAFVFLS